MGVNSLWDIVGPAARPVKLEALSRKKLAVDASIWIYQFLKAVRDKEGNSLGNTHIVGFFRRICKLLYFGILPLFVFDGGAPPLKRQTIQKRKDRRQGNRENAATTAHKLLAIQVQRQAHQASRARPEKKKRTPSSDSDSQHAYLEDLPILHPEHGPQSPSPTPVVIDSSPEKRFVKRDEYHLPELKQFTVLKADTRIMPASEFQEYADDASFDVVDGIPIDSVDPTSSEFAELPLATQYMILSHLRLRSRLRLGYTKDQLEELFPNSKDFSMFQIQQVQKRNFYTQKLMNVSGMDESNGNATRRIAGDNAKHYTLVNSGTGWTLSLGDTDTGPIELDDDGEMKEFGVESSETRERNDDIQLIGDRKIKTEIQSDSDDDLEDVPLSDKDDEEYDRAVIESIYDQYKGDYEDEKPSGLKRTNIEMEKLKEFDPVELKQAIELSKADYLLLKRQEEELLSVRSQNGSKGFDFGSSILFGNAPNLEIKPTNNSQGQVPQSSEIIAAEEKPTTEHVPATIESVVDNSETQTKNDKSTDKKSVDLDINDQKNESLIHWEEVDHISEDEKSEAEPAKEMPLWFSESIELNPHVQQDYETELGDRPNNNVEQTGLIPWSEARELIEGDSEDEKKSVEEEVMEISGPESTSEASKAEAIESPELVEHDSSELKIQAAEEEALQNRDASTQKSSQSKSTVKPKPAKSKATVIDYDFEEQDEEQLVRQLQDEEIQHAEFTSHIKSSHQFPSNTSVTDEQLLQEQLLKAKRDSDEVSENMIRDVQELLKRFGIPYMTAPMEAEAQCAELFRMGLVDGIVTDDSDCFLFGGSRIYKNMFNQKQYVECYIAEDIEHTLGLDNNKLIELALLLGSDYTEGIKGIGPVLAMEILAQFGDLDNFKEWFEKHTQAQKIQDEKPTTLERSLLGRIRNGKLFLPASFPDSIVKDAYKHPEVDNDDSEFKWGIPSLDQIRTFLMYNVGWSQAKVDEVMIPLIRDMNRKRAEGTQSTIGEFFPQEYISYKKEVNLGKRMKVAASKLKK